MQCTLQRRIYLRHSKCFDCLCQRCQDPTECDTFIGSLVCQRCRSAKLLPDNPLDDKSGWICTECSFKVTATNFQFIQNRLQFAIENLSKQNPYDFETFLEKYCYRPKTNTSNGNEDDLNAEILLHENNTFVLQIKYALTQLYGNVNGFLWHGMIIIHFKHNLNIHFEMEKQCSFYNFYFLVLLFFYLLAEIGDTDLGRKISLCRELLEVAKILEPGRSIFRGKLIVDLQEALFVQTERQLSNRDISSVVAHVSF